MDDLAVPQHHRSGAHRARRHPLLGALVAIVSVGAASALLLWLLLSFDVLGVGDGLAQEVAGVTGGAAPAASGSASAEPSAEPSTAPSAVAEPSPEPSPEPSADRSVTLDVLNSTATPGLAASAAERLVSAGWTTGGVDNFPGDERATVVLYPGEQLQLTAEAVAADLGVGGVEQSGDVTVVTVVVGADYQP